MTQLNKTKEKVWKWKDYGFQSDTSDCGHNWTSTFCGDGCKEHPGVWEVCVKCGFKRRVI